MPPTITGHFDADFSKFQTAVQQADLQLKSFESGSSRSRAP
jgi:hypothetical protein